MLYYPILLNIQEKKCCVIGGGSVAERKVRSLLRAGAQVTVVSPRVTAGLKRLSGTGRVCWQRSRYGRRFLTGAAVVIAATDDPEINRAVSRDASRAGSLINVVDAPAISTFIVPAVVHKAGLTVTVSTAGRAPALSRRIKQDLEAHFIAPYCSIVKTVDACRRRLKRTEPSSVRRRKLLAAMVDTLLASVPAASHQVKRVP